MKNLLLVNASPHMRGRDTTQGVMRDVLIALLPTLVAAVYLFGLRALLLCGVCVAACMLFEYLYRRLLQLPNTVSDLSAAVTGLLLALGLPVGLPLWMAVIGCFAAIVIVKQLFGGIGKNFANPAVVGRMVLFISFATPMTVLPLPFTSGVDAVSSATPLAALAASPAAAAQFDYMQLFLGTIGGSIGETCKVTLLLGFVYLLVRRIITPTATLAFAGSAVLFSFLMGQDPLYHLLSGSLIFGAVFMATDYTTTPTTEWGKAIFGLGCGIVTMVIRSFASYPEGISFAILLMNIATPLIDRVTETRAFGGVKS